MTARRFWCPNCKRVLNDSDTYLTEGHADCCRYYNCSYCVGYPYLEDYDEEKHGKAEGE